MKIMEGTLLMTMNTPHKQGAFDMDDKAVLRFAFLVPFFFLRSICHL